MFSLKTRIWLTVFTIVVMFTFFTLVYFPAQERKLLIENYDTEVQNLANTVALGVNIALTEQHFEGVETAMQFVKDDPRLQYVSIVEADTSWDSNHQNYKLEKNVFKTFPEGQNPDLKRSGNDSLVVKKAVVKSPIISGEIWLAFTTKSITENERTIRRTSLVVSGTVLVIGILLGFLLARQISRPVMALRNAASKIGLGDFSQRVQVKTSDEIGQLGHAFNKMAEELLNSRTALDKNNRELTETNSRLNKTLKDLRAMQLQLVQSEKMASLGEMSAGIAHEIQNPLNFVNNFSELNNELLEELKNAGDQGDLAQVRNLTSSLQFNEEKIHHHGKRADAIVKSMLQHSRKTSAQKELTDINLLADEYLQLSISGMHSSDKGFEPVVETNFDKDLSGQDNRISVVAQDIGRVILNLCNNALYSVHDKLQSTTNGFKPVVHLSTAKKARHVEITVTDNGEGIPGKIIDKIFQPFFTTKPTGEGTGLGLSLSYDIVKAHGGDLTVVSHDGDGAKFTVLLPIS